MIETLAPFVIYLPAGDEVEAASRSMALASGVRRVASDRVAGTAYASASEAGIPAITMEIGGQGVWDEEQVSQYVDACLGVLRHLGVLPGEQTLESGQRFYSSFNTITSSATGLWHPRVRVGETVDVGDRLGAMVDYFGTELQGIDAPVGGEVIYVVTSLAVNGGDPVLGITSRQ